MVFEFNQTFQNDSVKVIKKKKKINKIIEHNNLSPLYGMKATQLFPENWIKCTLGL